MNGPSFRKAPYQVLSILCVMVLVLLPMGALLAQDPGQQAAPGALLPPEQLDNLVAPIALYPDSLLSQVFVAATYPLEVVEAGQWLQQNRNLQGLALVNAAQQQNWDPSIQALVVFPDVLNLLTSNVRWTTDLGNAFLAQQADVMNAVQRMRAQAQASGRLSSNSQETVTTETQNGQPVIVIAPANPQVVYVPAYDPAYIWGPPAWGYYPPLYYPEFGYGFGSGIFIGSYFGGLGWGGWGWGPNWYNCTIVQNGFFFNRYGFRGFHGGFDRGYRGGFNGGVWAHNPDHRLGIPYPNGGVANRFGGARFAGARQSFGSTRGNFSNFGDRGSGAVASRGPGSVATPGAQQGGWRRFGESGMPGGRSLQSGVLGNAENRYSAPSVNRGGSGSRFGNPGSQQAYRSGPAFSGNTARAYSPNVGGGNAYRSAPSYGGGSAYRSAPWYGGGSVYRSAPSYGGGSAYRSAPSYGGGGYRSAPAFGGSGVRGSGGGSFRSAPSFGGGGGFRSAPSFGGGGGVRAAPSFGGGGGRSAPSFGGGGGGGFRGGGGGGGFRGGGGGGGSHGGGGGGGHRR